MISQADILVIDEISMLGSGIINHLAECLRAADHRPQLIFSGDFFQLPPVKEKCYPFEHPKWDLFGLNPIALTEIVRQLDFSYKEMLNRVRYSDVSCIPYFNTRVSRSPSNIYSITVCTTNRDAEEINKWRMESLGGKPVLYFAEGDSESADFSNTRVSECLKIKENMRVMTLRNDPYGKYQNGSLGTVVSMEPDIIYVRLDTGATIGIGRVTYHLDSVERKCSDLKVEQFPLKGAYAITIHKSQGQTFDSMCIMAPRCWAPGQLYVALSRARTIEGLHLMNPVIASNLMTDPRVIAYYQKLFQNVPAA